MEGSGGDKLKRMSTNSALSFSIRWKSPTIKEGEKLCGMKKVGKLIGTTYTFMRVSDSLNLMNLVSDPRKTWANMNKITSEKEAVTEFVSDEKGEITMYKRILLKLSGEALSGQGTNFDPEILKSLASQIKEIQDLGVEIAIVVGGGNFIRGKMAEKMGIERVQADYMGMLATVINALAIQSSLEQINVPTRVQTAIEMNKVAEPFIARRAIRHLEKGRVVIFGAGTGSRSSQRIRRRH